MRFRMLPAAALAAATVLTAAAPVAAAEQSADVVHVDVGGTGIDTATVPVDGLVNERVVPGDAGGSSIRVVNTGSQAGVLSAEVANVRFVGDAGDPFFGALLINGTPASELGEKPSLARDVALPVGGAATIDLSYLFPTEATVGNHGDRALGVSFDVRLDVTAEAAASPGLNAPGDAARGGGFGGALPWTGAEAAPWLGAGAALLGGGILLLLLARRRRRRGPSEAVRE
ncbi:hypothetical protein SAMN04489806_2054 [Paramicrobacterium humi]|uniref:LPXTG-motif cell wall anchor domain-containing protein n=1 Tax=Paramicrobacterium humi TaxID=640635 RepID=A0A1H4N247_9MICO|nr:hypothetical protein [Microbacterium humi]SEB89167.1 hypothetical protein SAMN04489806_2054 [Microbacterium humi]